MGGPHSQAIELLIEVGQLLSSKLEVGELLTTVLNLSSRVVDAESASLLLLDEKTQELYFDVALGLGEAASSLRLKLGQGIAGTVAKERKAEIINDVRKDPRWSPVADKQSGFVTRSILAVPMIIKGRLIGVIEAINKKTGDFDAEDLRTLEAFTSQASVAIENARLFSSLREERFKLQTIFAQMGEGAVLCDKDGRILLANAAAERYMPASGAQADSILVALKGMKMAPRLEDIFASPAPSQYFEAEREGPKRLILAGRATRVDLGAGRGEAVAGGGKPAAEPGWLCVFRDVTEERTKESLKRTFLSLISHKLKTPLATIIGYSDILLTDDSLSAELPRKAVKAISAQGQKLSSLVEKLLKYVTLEDTDARPEPKPCSVDQAVAGAVKIMHEWLAEQKAAVVFEPKGLMIMADETQLCDVLKNLIENAVKFDVKPEKRVVVKSQAENGRIKVIVEDTGAGIPPEDQDRIYSRFHQIEVSFTGQVDGWGLGLPFVKKVVELYGGQIKLESKLGVGTTVTLAFPQAPAKKP